MTAIKPLSQISEKWKSNASGASNSYRDGINAPRRPWKESTVAADESRKQGLIAADARNAFVTGVESAGENKWKTNATVLGTARYGQGVSNAQPLFQSGFAPYHQEIANTTLPPRGPKGSPETIERVRVIAAALHAKKMQG